LAFGSGLTKRREHTKIENKRISVGLKREEKTKEARLWARCMFEGGEK
jgi:hypothetical protein